MYARAQLKIPYNVTYVLRDKDGNIKPIWQENALAIFLMKHGILSPLHMKIPFLFGHWAKRKVLRNLVVNAGKAAMASRCNGAGAEAAFTSIGQGTGTTAPAATDTALQNGVTAAGVADGGVHVLPAASVTVSRVTTTVTNDTAQLQGTVAEAATIAITESGVFNADTGGTMLCRQTFAAINVVNGDNLQITWKIQFS